MSQVFHKHCKGCNLAKTAKTVGMRGFGSDNPKILVFLDNPSQEEDCRHQGGSSKGATFVQWLFKRMSIPPSEFRIEFSLKCHAESDQIKTKADFVPKLDACSFWRIAILQKWPKAIIVGMGSLTCFTFLRNQKHGEYAGAEWDYNGKRSLWVTYSPAVVFQSPAESPAIYRVLWKAAKQAGLKPKFNPNCEPFNYGD